MFDLLLRYAVSEDGSLHAEKFYRPAAEGFVALARVTASEFGQPAAGVAEARTVLKVV